MLRNAQKIEDSARNRYTNNGPVEAVGLGRREKSEAVD